MTSIRVAESVSVDLMRDLKRFTDHGSSSQQFIGADVRIILSLVTVASTQTSDRSLAKIEIIGVFTRTSEGKYISIHHPTFKLHNQFQSKMIIYLAIWIYFGVYILIDILKIRSRKSYRHGGVYSTPHVQSSEQTTRDNHVLTSYQSTGKTSRNTNQLLVQPPTCLTTSPTKSPSLQAQARASAAPQHRNSPRLAASSPSPTSTATGSQKLWNYAKTAKPTTSKSPASQIPRPAHASSKTQCPVSAAWTASSTAPA
jgi:hypothetical protein